jgi:hypothetical protein
VLNDIKSINRQDAKAQSQRKEIQILCAFFARLRPCASAVNNITDKIQNLLKRK